uniref:Putative secreted protein n=2 Tax=argyritarsis section TaxID=44545 RepID=A0A2M4D7H5_ANODA
MPLMFHRFDCICCIRLASFSFCVSANLTTSGAEQPSIVLLWCSCLIALMADCLVANVTKAQPLLSPDGSRSTVHSSMTPWPEKRCRTSFSLYFLLSIPTNSLRSGT